VPTKKKIITSRKDMPPSFLADGLGSICQGSLQIVVGDAKLQLLFMTFNHISISFPPS
jgi:hypothetical protein